MEATEFLHSLFGGVTRNAIMDEAENRWDDISMKFEDNQKVIEKDDGFLLESLDRKVKFVRRLFQQSPTRSEIESLWNHLPSAVRSETTSFEDRKSVVTEWTKNASENDFRDIGAEAVVGLDDDRLPVEFFERGFLAKRSVGLVKVMGRAKGTGFLVGQRLLITNHHVITDELDAQAGSVIFDMEENKVGALSAEEEYSLRPDRFFCTNKELDFTLVACNGKSEDRRVEIESYGDLPLKREEGKTAIGRQVNVIQHPGGENKVVSCRQGKVVSIDNNDQARKPFLYYTADTNPGSSGSPVFNDNFEVVGIHHHSFPRRDKNGQILDKRGKRLTKEAALKDPNRVDWIANEGTRISRLVAAFETMPLANAEMEMIRKAVLEDW